MSRYWYTVSENDPYTYTLLLIMFNCLKSLNDLESSFNCASVMFMLFQGAAGTNLCPGGVLVSLRSGHTWRIPLVLLRRHADGLRYTPGEQSGPS